MASNKFLIDPNPLNILRKNLKLMYIKSLASLLLLFFWFNSLAQNTDSFETKYNRENIVRLGSGGFMKGGAKLKFGDLRDEFNKSSLGLELYEDARRSRTNATIFRYGALASLIASVSVASSTSASSRNNFTTSIILLGADLLFTLLGNESKKRYLKQVDQALIERNRQMLFH